MTEHTQDAKAADAALVARCLSGDEAAWERLVDRYSALVWSIGRRAGLAGADLADVYQTVWRIAVEDLPRLRDRRRFGTWIGRITHFQSKRLLRGYSMTRRALGVIPVTEEDGRSPEEELMEMERRRQVHAAFAQVGERCKSLLALLYFEQPTPAYAVIADRLDMKIGSIGPTRARCLERLARKLRGQGHDLQD